MHQLFSFRRWILVCITCFLAFGAAAQVEESRRLMAPPGEASSTGDGPTGPCADGIVKDDSTADTAYGWVPTVIDGRYVQEFRLDEMPTDNIETVCVCLRRTMTDTDIDFEVHFYRHEPVTDDDGVVDWIPEMEPYAVVPASATNVTDAVEGTWVEVDTGSVELPLGPFFSVGVKWDPSVEDFFFVCADTNEDTPPAEAWFKDDRAEGWTSALNTIDPIFNFYRAFLLRVVPGPPLPATVEIPTMSFRGLGLLALVLAGIGLVVIRRR